MKRPERKRRPWAALRRMIHEDHPSFEELDQFVESGEQVVTDDSRLAAIPLHLRLCEICAEYVEEATSGFESLGDLLSDRPLEEASQADWNRLKTKIAAIEDTESSQISVESSGKYFEHFAPTDWAARLSEWFQLNPAPALAVTSGRLSTLLKSAGPAWTVDEVLGVEISIIPMQGQLWLSCAGEGTNRMRFLSLSVDDQDLTGVDPFRRRDLLLIPLGQPGMSRVDIRITDGAETDRLTIKFRSEQS